MKVLVACEESQAVTIAFRELGHEAYSCDLYPCSGSHPEWHLQQDVIPLLAEKWDLMIAHPPCTFLCRHRSRWEEEKGLAEAGKEFFMKILNSNIPRICVENPVPLKKWGLPPYTQIIQPWQFGHDYSKKTCLWLRGLPPLRETNRVEITYYITPNGRKFTAGWYKTPRNSKARSKTFFGIARAMAQQWGG
jgi:hypothetical protein